MPPEMSGDKRARFTGFQETPESFEPGFPG
jgi:hypothetical protein